MRQSKLSKSDAYRFALFGALTGVIVPLFHTAVQLFFLHPDMSIPAYISYSLTGSGEVLAANVTAWCAVALMGAGGYYVGRSRDQEAGRNREVEARNREYGAISSIESIIANVKDKDSLLYTVLRETLSLGFLNIEGRGAVFVVDENSPERLRMAANIKMDSCMARMDGGVELGQCLCGRAVKTGEVITATGCLGEKLKANGRPGPKEHGHIAVPIKGRQGSLGVFVICTPTGREATEDDIRLLTSIAAQLAFALENMALARTATVAKEDLEVKSIALARKVQELNSLVEVDRIILSTLDRDEMLFNVSVQIRQLVPSDVGGVALADPDTGDYRYIGGWGMEIKNRDIMLTADWLGSPALSYGKPLLRTNIEDEVIMSPFDKLLFESGVRSDLYAPIVRKGKTVGIFFLGSFRVGGFRQQDVDTALGFASRMGIALEHSRLIYDLDEMSVNIIHALATAIDAKSSWTKGHSERVSDYAMRIAEKMNIPKNHVERLRLAGLLHDVGKIGTYDILLDKTEKLTEDEWRLIKLHPVRGCEILEPIKEFKDIIPAVRHHHERWDGRGYPEGLKGEEIPLMARIICLADSFDTMTADRPYRPSIGFDNAIQEIRFCTGTQFAPDVSAAFLQLAAEQGMEITDASHMLRQPHDRLIWGSA